jgi:hypothetical protein
MAFLFAAALLLIAVARHPSVDLRLMTHDSADLNPHRMQAAFDLGVATVSLLFTWTSKTHA